MLQFLRAIIRQVFSNLEMTNLQSCLILSTFQTQYIQINLFLEEKMKRVNERKRTDPRKYSLHDDHSSNKHLIMNPPPSTHDLKKIIKSLENQVKEERAKRQKLEQHFTDYQKRSVYREEEFYKIIDRCNLHRKSSIRNNAEIEEIYNHILKNFDEANEKTHQLLEANYKTNYDLMERRVSEVVHTMELELEKCRKMSKDNLLNLKNDINEILKLAKKIQQENYQARTKITDLEFKNRLLKEEKKLVIEELVSKKKKVVQLNAVIDSQKPKDMLQNYQSIQTLESNPRFMGEPALKEPSSPKHSKSQRPRTYRRKRTKEEMEPKQKRVIDSLKHTLQREKQKNKELSSIVFKVQNKNKEINEAIEDCMKQGSNNKSMDVFLKSDNLFKTINKLKRRLSMTENPAVSCGWGTDIQCFVTE